MKEKLKELPFGIIFGISLIACFYLTVAFVALYIVLNGVEAQTGGSITIFEHWYQILIFIFDIIFFITLILSLIFAASSYLSSCIATFNSLFKDFNSSS